ncbi:MAG: Ig-like domain-containing protein [Gemmatimonadaceae bacterium]
MRIRRISRIRPMLFAPTLISLLVAALGCGDRGDPFSVAERPASLSVKGGAPSALTPDDTVLTVGQSVQMSGAPVADSGRKSRPAVWSSSDNGVATVSTSGQVTAVAVGTTTITAASGRTRSMGTVTVTDGSVGSGTAPPPATLSGQPSDTAVVPAAVPASLNAVPAVSARSADAFVNSIGVNTHLNYLDLVYGTGYASIIRPKLVSLGVRHIRDGLNVWPEVATRYRELATHGVKLTAVTEPKDGNYDDASHILPQADVISSALEAFEGPNEPDLFWAVDWTGKARRFQQAVYTAVKGSPAWGRTPVVQMALSGFGAPPAVGDMSGYADQGNLHPYPGGKQPTNLLQSYLGTWAVINGADPLHVTETGYHTAPASADSWQTGVSESAQAKYVPRLFLEYFLSGIQRTFLYELIDERANLTRSEDNYGLLRNDGSEKPAYIALKNTIALLADPGPTFTPGQLGYDLSGDLSNVHSLLLQKRDGTFYLVLWLDVPSYDHSQRRDLPVSGRPLTLTLATPARETRTYFPLESMSPSAQTGAVTQLRVTVPDHPMIIKLVPQ